MAAFVLFIFSDLWGLVSLSIATCYYLQYNLIMLYDGTDTSHSSLYLHGDYWYLVNAVCYFICAMRDNEWFWFMPSHGKPQCFLEIAKQHYYTRERERECVRERERECMPLTVISGGKELWSGSGSKYDYDTSTNSSLHSDCHSSGSNEMNMNNNNNNNNSDFKLKNNLSFS